jgi:hypothetical protein
LSKIDRFGHQFPAKTSPRLAERDFSLEPKARNNKKPGNERRANPSLFREPLSRAPRTDELEARFVATRCS